MELAKSESMGPIRLQRSLQATIRFAALQAAAFVLHSLGRSARKHGLEERFAVWARVGNRRFVANTAATERRPLWCESVPPSDGGLGAQTMPHLSQLAHDVVPHLYSSCAPLPFATL